MSALVSFYNLIQGSFLENMYIYKAIMKIQFEKD